ncbi:MAG: tRNA methyltransferase 10 C [Marteilia pararefringens]
MTSMASRQKLKLLIDNLFESYNIPVKVNFMATTRERVSYVRGIYNILRGEGIDTPRNLTDEVAHDMSFKNRNIIAKTLRNIFHSDKDRELKQEIEKEKQLVKDKMLEKFGSVDNFPLPGFYMERYESERLHAGFFQKALHIDNSEQPNIVIDCGYKHQSMQMKRLLNSQLQYVHSFVKQSQNPMKISFTSVGDVMRLPESILRYSNTPLYEVTSDDVSSVKSNKTLVYLSPHSSRKLTHISKNCTYIIGGVVDIHDTSPYSMSRARKFNAQTASLPLDTFFKWEQGSKSLTVDQVVKIIMTLWETHNWYEALSFVPRRKALPTRELINLKSTNTMYCKYVSFQNNFSEEDIYEDQQKRYPRYKTRVSSRN